MAEVTKEETLKKIEELVSEMKDKAFNAYFFVIDTKGSPDGSVQYTYDIAYGLYTLGYKVTKLRREKYANLDLKGLLPGEYRPLTVKEVKILYSLCKKK